METPKCISFWGHHDWSKWCPQQDTSTEEHIALGKHIITQIRTCQTCGMVEQHDVVRWTD